MYHGNYMYRHGQLEEENSRFWGATVLHVSDVCGLILGLHRKFDEEIGTE